MKTWVAWVTGAAVVVVVAVAILLMLKWPFTQSRTVASLEKLALSKVTVGQFRMVFLPHPGYIAENIVFSRVDEKGARVPLARLQRLECISTWWAVLLLDEHAKELRVEGLRVQIPSPVPKSMHLHPQGRTAVTVSELVANGAELEIAAKKAGQPPFRLQFPGLKLHHIEKGKPVHVVTAVRNADAPGMLQLQADVSLPSLKGYADTRLDGTFQLRGVDLRRVKNLEGLVLAQGAFQGGLRECMVRGTAVASDFGVMSSGHKQDLRVAFDAQVNGTNGDVRLQKVSAQFLKTKLQVTASITGMPVTAGQGKQVTIQVRSDEARVEDLMQLLVKEEHAPLSGPMKLRAEIQLPPGPRPFLDRVEMQGDFRLRDLTFTEARQEKVDELSARARGRHVKKDVPNERVESGLDGHVDLRNGTARLTSWRFTVPGAQAKGGGTFELQNQEVEVAGHLAMQASLSKAVGGMKSILLLPLNPFFRKDGAGAVVPFTMNGRADHPKFRVTLREKHGARGK